MRRVQVKTAIDFLEVRDALENFSNSLTGPEITKYDLVILNKSIARLSTKFGDHMKKLGESKKKLSL